MINEIKRRLDAGETVELECIDRDGFLNARKASHLNESILKLDVLEVECVNHLAVFLVGDCPGIIPSDLKYFKIKGREPIFDDLVDKAIKAVRDYVAIITHLELDNITIESIDYDLLSPLEIYREDAPEKIQKAIDWIDSLYTETFVFEGKEDLDRMARLPIESIILTNGEDIVRDVWIDDEDALRWRGIGQLVKLKVLKGATITQRKRVA